MVVFAGGVGVAVEEAAAEEPAAGWRVLVVRFVAVAVDWRLLVVGIIVAELSGAFTVLKVGSGSEPVFVSVKNGN